MKTYLVILLSSISFILIAQSSELNQNIDASQEKGYTLSLALGMSSYEGDLHCFDDEELGTFSQSKFAFGIGVAKQLSSTLTLGLNYRMINIAGNDNDFAELGHQRRGFSFDNSIHEINARLDYEPFAKENWKLRPYVFGGIGVALGSPNVDYNKNGLPNNDLITQINEDEMESGGGSLVAPLGFGAKINIANNITIAAEAGLRFLANDYIDGVSKSGNSSVNDYYGMGAVVIGYSF